MRKIVSRRPLIISAIVTLIFWAALMAVQYSLPFMPRFFYSNGVFLPQLIADAFSALVGIALAFILGYGHIFDRTSHFFAGLFCGGAYIVISLIQAYANIMVSLSDEVFFEPVWRIIVFTLSMLAVGLAEETYFRGIISNLFWDKHAKDSAGVWTAALYSGLIFGLMHFINILSMDPSGWGGGFAQIAGACVTGLCFTAIYYRCKNIWVLIFIHAFLDFCGLISEGLFGGTILSQISNYSPLTAVTSSVMPLIVTLVIFRKKKMAQTLADVPEADRPETGYIPQPLSEEESAKSKRAFKRAVIIFAVCWVLLFIGSVALNPDVQSAFESETQSDRVLDITDAGDWSGEQTFGKSYKFTVGESRSYRINIVTAPSENSSYVLVQIKSGEEVVFEQTYGGICSTTFGLDLDKGDYVLNLVYDYSRVSGGNAEYDTSVIIK